MKAGQKSESKATRLQDNTLVKAFILNTFDNDKKVFEGSVVNCEKYLSKNNEYQINYSNLKIAYL